MPTPAAETHFSADERMGRRRGVLVPLGGCAAYGSGTVRVATDVLALNE